jgi:hypothetical protein
MVILNIYTLTESTFFRYIHISMMFAAVAMISIGTEKSKLLKDDKAKHRAILIWFTLALILIFFAIPWPTSPFANRPLLRVF